MFGPICAESDNKNNCFASILVESLKATVKSLRIAPQSRDQREPRLHTCWVRVHNLDRVDLIGSDLENYFIAGAQDGYTIILLE